MKLLNEFAIQLYSVKDVTNDDFIGTLAKLGKNGFGYTGVEFAGYGDLSAEQMNRALSENGLTAISSHVGLERLLSNLDEEIAYNKEIDCKYIICPWADMETRGDVLTLAKKLKPVAEKISDSGLKFGYHNHAHEFAMDNGEYLLDVLFENLPSETVMELDVYWSEYADVDTLAYMKKNERRLEILHCKQIDSDKKNVDLDKGSLDFSVVIKNAKSLGVEHFIVEQEYFEESSIVSAENNASYILNLEEND